jgi:hypothetical protein
LWRYRASGNRKLWHRSFCAYDDFASSYARCPESLSCDNQYPRLFEYLRNGDSFHRNHLAYTAKSQNRLPLLATARNLSA